MPSFFVFDDVYLFKPKIPTSVRINPENCPTGEVPAAALAITNDSRKGAGLVGARLSANREFGPTSEPFEGTNIIGRVIDTDKLKESEGAADGVYPRGEAMTDYSPANVGTVTRYVVVESYTVTPADVATRAYEVAKGSYDQGDLFRPRHHGNRRGCQPGYSRGQEDGPGHIFVKDRGFPPGDARRCRATLGGARPGFHGIEFEMTILPYISHAIEELDHRDAATVPVPEVRSALPRLDVYRLKKMIDAQEP